MMASGALTQADAAKLFDRERRTIASWIKAGHQPTGARANETFEILKQLERAVKAGRGLPIPLRLSKRERAAYVRELGAKLERARLSKIGPSP